MRNFNFCVFGDFSKMDDLASSLDFCSISNHHRTIVHIDVDCFYAQVEMLKNPSLRNKPLGIQQKNIVVTSNYLAREYGIKKCMLVTESLKLCPNLVLVNGEDLSDYRQISSQITSTLHKFSIHVEKLGLDENFVDITNLVSERMLKGNSVESVEGNLFGDADEKCECGCKARLFIGSHIAKEMREEIRDSLGITCCGGIGHNKLLAKLVCATHKPNQQTTVLPSSALYVISQLKSVRGIPGIGHRMQEALQSLGISTVEELRNCSLTALQKAIGKETAITVKKLSYGVDDSPVKPTGKPQSIGIEDGFRKISLKSEVKDKFATLLQRLLKLMSQDGRIPGSIRVTVRKYDSVQKRGHRESRQCNIPAAFFSNSSCDAKSFEKLMTIIMKLFHKMVDIAKPFHLTLVGLAFTKFQERNTGKSSIASFLTNDISVQSILSFKNISSDTELMDCSSGVESCSYAGFTVVDKEKATSGSEQEPEIKKTRVESLFPRTTKRLSSEDNEALPSKRLLDSHSDNSNDKNSMEVSYTTDKESCDMLCPGGIDKEVFLALPPDLQQEVINEWKGSSNDRFKVSQVKQSKPQIKPKQKSLLQYFLPDKS